MFSSSTRLPNSREVTFHPFRRVERACPKPCSLTTSGKAGSCVYAAAFYRLTAFPETPYADLIVAWLAAGEKAVVSHESALLLYGLTDLLPAEVHLTVPRTASRRAGVRLHTSRLSDDEITFRHGLPVTILSRTLVDLTRSGVDEEWIRQAVHQALARGLVSETTLQEKAGRHGGQVAAAIHRALALLIPP